MCLQGVAEITAILFHRIDGRILFSEDCDEVPPHRGNAIRLEEGGKF